jgi:hypothetical protein
LSGRTRGSIPRPRFEARLPHRYAVAGPRGLEPALHHHRYPETERLRSDGVVRSSPLVRDLIEIR